MRLTFWPGLSSAGRRAGPALALVLAISPWLAACNIDRLLESSRPSAIDAEKLADPSQADLLLNGVLAGFQCAHGAWVAGGALIGDEMEDAQLAAAVWDWDRRTFNSSP